MYDKLKKNTLRNQEEDKEFFMALYRHIQRCWQRFQNKTHDFKKQKGKALSGLKVLFSPTFPYRFVLQSCITK